ncbi:anti-sigma factor family protein [Frigoriglobus tundricola]|uniref:anti-sigma factor family protein n=1 Tax=Frigoriglobus tundricola TaxID=2774151 RepID=UPI00148ECC33|nr:anti-sigma factor [Frigoriglobus tundricola]
MICRRAAEVITQSLDGPITLRVRVALGVHTLFCSPCRRFRRQMVRLQTAFRASANAEPPAGGEGLSPAARERIAAALNRTTDSG